MSWEIFRRWLLVKFFTFTRNRCGVYCKRQHFPIYGSQLKLGGSPAIWSLMKGATSNNGNLVHLITHYLTFSTPRYQCLVTLPVKIVKRSCSSEFNELISSMQSEETYILIGQSKRLSEMPRRIKSLFDSIRRSHKG